MKLKKCKTCGELKPLDEFYKNKNTKDGFWTECKECNIKRTKKWQKENPEKKKKLQRDYWYRHRKKLIKETKKNYDKREYQGNRERAIQRDGEKCVKCGITREEHKNKWGKDLNVDHIDRNRENNKMENLQTLCLECHGKKDNGGKFLAKWKNGLTEKQKKELEEKRIKGMKGHI